MSINSISNPDQQIKKLKRGRRTKSKIQKTPEEFKSHEANIMNKRINRIDDVLTRKSCDLWQQYLWYKKQPNIKFHFEYHGLQDYLKKCDEYEPDDHKDSKQKWWNNQKASEMSQDFLPNILNASDKMAVFIGKQIHKPLQYIFGQYVTFELLETSINSVFSTQRSGSNEVFLRTSFQYAKADLRKKLQSYFNDNELVYIDNKGKKKKNIWQKLIKNKKDKLLEIFLNKKSMYPHLNASRMRNRTSSSNTSAVRHSINDNHCNNYNYNNDTYITSSMQSKYGYNNMIHQLPVIPQPLSITSDNSGCNQCIDYMNQINKCSKLLMENQRLLTENIHLKRVHNNNLNDKMHWKHQYDTLLMQFNQIKQNQYQFNNNNNNCNSNGMNTDIDDQIDFDLNNPCKTPSQSYMSITGNGANNGDQSSIFHQPIIPFDNQTTDEFNTFNNINNGCITPIDLNHFEFPSTNNNNNNTSIDDTKSQMTSSTLGKYSNQNSYDYNNYINSNNQYDNNSVFIPNTINTINTINTPFSLVDNRNGTCSYT